MATTELCRRFDFTESVASRKLIKVRDHQTFVDSEDCVVTIDHRNSRLPRPGQTPASGIIHLDRIALAARVFHFFRRAIVQVFASEIFHFNNHAIQQSVAPGVIHLNRRNLAPRVIHLNHHILWQLLRPIAF
jgi:hypothetical protein